jgi:hypothetical protein
MQQNCLMLNPEFCPVSPVQMEGSTAFRPLSKFLACATKVQPNSGRLQIAAWWFLLATSGKLHHGSFRSSLVLLISALPTLLRQGKSS